MASPAVVHGSSIHVEHTSTAPPSRPNFLFILVDDLGWRDLHCFGSQYYLSPNIDKLASSGMKFTNAYSACCVCSPSRAAIMTGQYPARLHLTDYIYGANLDNAKRNPARWPENTPFLPAYYIDHLPLKQVTVAEAMKQAGYATFFAGKWHLGGKQYWPNHQGFDVNLVMHFTLVSIWFTFAWYGRSVPTESDVVHPAVCE